MTLQSAGRLQQFWQEQCSAPQRSNSLSQLVSVDVGATIRTGERWVLAAGLPAVVAAAACDQIYMALPSFPAASTCSSADDTGPTLRHSIAHLSIP